MNNMMVEALKWIVLVLVAGFIGYFGRYAAMQIIDKYRRNNSGNGSSEKPQGMSGADGDKISEAQIKLEKKRAKNESKRLKKKDKT